MASLRTLAWLDRGVWTLVYAGLLTLVLGLATGDAHRTAGWSLVAVGAAVAAVGVALWVARARVTPAAPTGAQSSAPSPPGHR